MIESQGGFEVRNRPDWLYNALPYIYVAIGVIVVLGLGTSNLIGVFSGILLISTGGVVFTMRVAHRQELAKLRAEFARNEAGESVDEYREDEIDRRKNDRRQRERRQSQDDSTSGEFSETKEHEPDNSIVDSHVNKG